MTKTRTTRAKNRKAAASHGSRETIATEIQSIPLAEIERDAANHRLDQPTASQKIQELAESLRNDGQQQPVQLFTYPDDQPPAHGRRYLLVFGFRRCAAAELNGWTEIAAVVKPMPLLPDGSIDRLTIERLRSIENLQRENLNPIEECVLVEQFVNNLPADLGGTPPRQDDGRLTEEAVRFLARSIGRTEAWVRDRLYLSRLSPELKQKVMEGKLFLVYAREIAKLADHAEQERLAGMCEANPLDGHCSTTIHQVRRYVAERQNSLRAVPWQLDKEFPKHKAVCGPCSTCSFNSSNDKQLFEHDGSPAPETYCLRTSCFEAKQTITQKALEAAVAKIVQQKKLPTEGTAAEVAAEFVKPSRVARQARKKIDGAEPKKPAVKPQYWETPEYKARAALSDAERTWREQVAKSLTEQMRKHPGRLTSLLLIGITGAIRSGMSEKEVAKLSGLLKLTVKPTWQNLLKVERAVLMRKHFDIGDVISLHDSELLVNAVAKLYSVEVPSCPKLEDYLPAQSEGPAEAQTVAA
ncbi:MAG: ParB N-terminal domain-containing protein [Planctomycetes bacterium]|nr:ParB N-terminal domain-containing protein [Planctomycetota bacterium]